MEDQESVGGKPTQWIKKHGCYLGAPQTQTSIPAAIYGAEDTDDGIGLKEIKFPADSLSRLPGLPIDFIINQISDFWNRAKKFNDLGLVHKRGILLYGPAGCGKTSIIRLLCDDVVARGGAVLDITDVRLGVPALQLARTIEPERPMMTIIEDIDNHLCDKNDDPSPKLLSMLDGELQVDHVVHLATTNRPELLEDRIIRRPGRFDLVIGLGYPIREAREAYLLSYLKDDLGAAGMKAILDRTEGFGLSHLRELVVSHYCLGVPLDETLARLSTSLKARHRLAKKSNEISMGFTVNFGEEKAA